MILDYVENVKIMKCVKTKFKIYAQLIYVWKWANNS